MVRRNRRVDAASRRSVPELYTAWPVRAGRCISISSGRTWIAPSSGGLLWIRGTENHLVTTPGIDHDVIYSISGGPGEVWVGRRLGGVTQLREEAGVLRRVTYTAADGLAPGVVNAVHRSRDGSVWAGTLSGAVSRIQKGRVTTFTTANGLSADAVTTIQEARRRSDLGRNGGRAGGVSQRELAEVRLAKTDCLPAG